MSVGLFHRQLLQSWQRSSSKSMSSATWNQSSMPGIRWNHTSTPSKCIVYESRSTDPYFNLAFEDWLFRATSQDDVVLLTYRNTPSVIIGRNQNPWKELNINEMKKSGIKFVRRMSGGGTVYHDLGNTNYCVIQPRRQFDRRVNAEMVSSALNTLNIPASVNERHDIVVDNFKISGSAFKLINQKAYHHGTMLLDADLTNLKSILNNEKNGITTKGVLSVRSPVKNLRYWSETINHNNFIKAVEQTFRHKYSHMHMVNLQIFDEKSLPPLLSEDAKQTICKKRDELLSWEWMYGQTPEFTHQMETKLSFGKISVSMLVRHGIIESTEITCWIDSQIPGVIGANIESLIQSLENDLTGIRYHYDFNLNPDLYYSGVDTKPALQELVNWIRNELS